MRLDKYTLCIIILILESFWGLISLNRYTSYIITFFLFVISFVEMQSIKLNESNKIVRLPLIFTVFVCVNIFFCWLNRGQSIHDSIGNVEYRYYVYFLLFYLLYRSRITIQECETTIYILYFLFSLAYILEYFVFFPKPVICPIYFEEEEHRMRLLGQAIGFLGYFYCLNKFLTKKENRILNISGILLGNIVVFTLGFRSVLVAFIIGSLYLIYKVNNQFKKTIFTSIGLLSILMFIIDTEYGHEIIEHMLDRQQFDTYANEDYIRVLELNYYMTDHFVSVTDFIFGSGIPSGNSHYCIEMLKLANINEFGEVTTSVTQWRDWGILGFSWILGLPAAFVLLYFVFYMIFAKTDREHIYLSATYLVFILTCITTMELYRHGAFAIHAMAFYLMYQLKRQNKYGVEE